MKRRCGNCIFAANAGPESILCHGAPPSVTGVEAKPDGSMFVHSQLPALHPKRPPCALHIHRWSPRGIWRLLTSVR
jgi:hypothetical protein